MKFPRGHLDLCIEIKKLHNTKKMIIFAHCGIRKAYRVGINKIIVKR